MVESKGFLMTNLKKSIKSIFYFILDHSSHYLSFSYGIKFILPVGYVMSVQCWVNFASLVVSTWSVPRGPVGEMGKDRWHCMDTDSASGGQVSTHC